MISVANIRTALSSVIKLKKNKVRFCFPVIIKRRTRLDAGENVFVGRNGYFDVGELRLHKGVAISNRARFVGSQIEIDSWTNINERTKIIVGNSKCLIGKYCAIGPQVSVWGVDHDYNLPGLQVRFYKEILGWNYNFRQSSICVGNDVQIGERVIILPGVTIGNGAIIGAGAVVTQDVSPYSIVAGVPARYIKHRFRQDVIEFLENIRWWNWNIDRIKRNARFFQLDLNMETNLRLLSKRIM